METQPQAVRSDFEVALTRKIREAADEIRFYLGDGWARDKAIAYVAARSTFGPHSWARVLALVDQP